MRLRVFGLTALALALQPAQAQEATKQPAPHPFKSGELFEVRTETTRSVTETLSFPEEEPTTSRLDLKRKVRFVDRIEAVSQGQVTQLTRHVVAIDLREMDGTTETELRGRQVKLTRSPRGEISAKWTNGWAVGGRDLEILQELPWPTFGKEWRVDLGTRKEALKIGDAGNWKAPENVPAFVATLVEEVDLRTPLNGEWKLELEGDLEPVGTARGQASLNGKSSEPSDDGDVVLETKVEVRHEIQRKRATEMPQPLPPPADPEEGFDLDEDEDMEPLEEEPLPDDEPLPEDDEEPVPEDDEEPLPEDEDEPLPDDEDE